MRRWLEKAALAARILPYLARPVGSASARTQIQRDLARREARFLDTALGVLDDARSPHGQLLRWAGWSSERLERTLRERGLEGTLAVLGGAGVRTTFDEFRCRVPISREGLTVRTEPGDFERPDLRKRGLRASTSGTSGEAVQVPYDWPLFREEAALECLLFEAHGVLGAPCVFWLPGLPSIAGLHNLVVHLGFRQPPVRWFTQGEVTREHALASRYLRAAAAPFGLRVPAPEHVPYSDAARVARLLAVERDRAGAASLKTFASSAVRVAEAARSEGLDLGGVVIFAGGEPLTERRRAYIESTGARAVPRYVATETGWIAGGCAAPGPGDRMHLYTTRLAAIPESADRPGPLLLTTISPTAGKVLLNTELGDLGRIAPASCGCTLAEAGLDTVVSGLCSDEKISLEGATLPRALLDEVIDGVLGEHGEPPDSHVLGVEEDEVGRWRGVVVVRSTTLDPDDVLTAAYERLRNRGPAAQVAAEHWRTTAALMVRHAPVEPGRSAKLRSAPALRG